MRQAECRFSKEADKPKTERGLGTVGVAPRFEAGCSFEAQLDPKQETIERKGQLFMESNCFTSVGRVKDELPFDVIAAQPDGELTVGGQFLGRYQKGL